MRPGCSWRPATASSGTRSSRSAAPRAAPRPPPPRRRTPERRGHRPPRHDQAAVMLGRFGRQKDLQTSGEAMSKDNQTMQPPRDGVISIIGPGMRVIGDCETEGTLRIEGTVEGTVRAGKAVVIGKDGAVQGDVLTQDAVIGGRVSGTIIAESRLELQATCI